MVREWVSINGRLMQPEQAQISAFDAGLLQGVGLFETMRAYQGRVFRARRHLERLAKSAQTLGWSSIPEIDRMNEQLCQVVNATELADARVRLTVTTGTLRPSERETPELTILATAVTGGLYPPELYARGISMTVSRWRQNPFDPLTGHKAVSYFSRLASLREAHAAGAMESLWLTIDNEVAEGAISNVFIVKDGALRTPPTDLPVLPGVTRATVLELAGHLGIPAAEQRLQLEDVLDADEVFVTNSMMELLSVIGVDQHAIGSGKPGALTRRLHEAYGECVRRECSNAQG
ncbi:MAG: aminotransferase class IV [Planctomycetia bacterium]|nr:MAG: aminotransferase class IV [Planctomycetia bacterium]